MKNFRTFSLNENYTLTVADSMDSFKDWKKIGEGEDWCEQFDVSDIWSEYKNKKIDENQFVRNYNKRLIEKRDELIKIGVRCWNELVKLIKEKEDFTKHLEDVYDWADKYGIKIISEKKV